MRDNKTEEMRIEKTLFIMRLNEYGKKVQLNRDERSVERVCKILTDVFAEIDLFDTIN